MTDDNTKGPWALALGTLAVGVAAVGAEILRRRRDDGGNGGPERDTDAPTDADEEWAVDRGPGRR